ncbi:MAG: fibronectin type III domain-containing protein, partial [bacterium]|nr:fibronectin type III domain-containing protein [bacterium]
DPGPTHGSEIIFRESDSVSVSFAVPVATQSPGFHVLGIRVNDRAGNWSLPTTRPLWIEHLPSTTVSGAEWFLDTDPGAVAANTVIVTPADSVGMQFIASLPNVGPGMHVFGFRVRAQNNKWSLPVYRPFWLEQLASQNITRVEYSFDSLASPGFGTPLPIITGDSVGASVTVPLTSMSYGFHQVWIRVKDQSEKWSHPISRCFWNGNYNQTTPNITRAEYFLDNDPGIGNATSVAIANADSVHANFLLSLTGVSLGNHSLFVRVRDENGKWSQPAFSGFVIPQPPGSPSLLTIQYLNPGALLSWTPPENQVAGYRIYRSVNGYFNPPETGTLVGSVSGTTTTFIDTGVTGRCFYRVTAIDGLTTSQRREPNAVSTTK